MVEAHHHRPTLKQQNKKFKSKHATKASLKEAAKGRVGRQSPKSTASQKSTAQLRQNRRNTAKQTQTKKRHALVSATRSFNAVDGAPRIVAVVPLTPDIDTRNAIKAVAQSLDTIPEDCTMPGLSKMKADRFKTSLQFINLPYRSLYATIDACKVADYVLLLLSPETEVDSWGDTLLRILQAQGLPSVVTAIPDSGSSDAKTRASILKSLLSFVQYFLPTQTRVYDLRSGSDVLNAIRALSEGKPSDVRWREGRSYVLAEQVDWVDDKLTVTGVVRGAGLSADRLVHLPNYGDFQVDKIMSAPLPKQSKSGSHTGMDVEPVLLAEPNASSADSLISTNDPDDMENEQTWPTEEELQGVDRSVDEDRLPDAHNGTTPTTVRRVPKGTSSYQAAWILEDDEEDADAADDHESAGDNGEVDMGPPDTVPLSEIIEAETEMESESRRSVSFQDLEMNEEQEQLRTWRSRAREEQDDLQFPDEIETPMDVPARVRFQRFRGLRSLRTSPWDPYENLPRDYARIFQFEDFKRTERGVMRRAEQDSTAVQPGNRVTIVLRDVPRDAVQRDLSSPLVLFGLFQHEHKKTVLNFTVQRNTEYDGSVRSKDSLVLCVGPRRLVVNPVYSQHTRGGSKGANNVHKFERYLRHGSTSVATIYGPAVIGKQPCVLLREGSDPQAPALVASGSFLHPDPTRIIAKRIVLTGHPFKVHKKTATVRYMFFNPDDAMYFAPVQLHTKYGRTGHIRESLGTHGYFKAHFDGPLNQMDTVCMSLYKRVYPKWSELWKESGERPGQEQTEEMGDAMEE